MVESKQRHHRPIDLLVNFLVVVVVDHRQEERLAGADDAGDRSIATTSHDRGFWNSPKMNKPSEKMHDNNAGQGIVHLVTVN